ncbi:MAG TPA: hypothetical protein VF280_00225, partial [Burkholderiales bacterium]
MDGAGHAGGRAAQDVLVSRRVAVLGGVRIPFARANGAYMEASNQDMLTAAMKALVLKFNLENARLGEVAA